MVNLSFAEEYKSLENAPKSSAIQYRILQDGLKLFFQLCQKVDITNQRLQVAAAFHQKRKAVLPILVALQFQ
jgi:hypothetical protein